MEINIIPYVISLIMAKINIFLVIYLVTKQKIISFIMKKNINIKYFQIIK